MCVLKMTLLAQFATFLHHSLTLTWDILNLLGIGFESLGISWNFENMGTFFEFVILFVSFWVCEPKENKWYPLIWTSWENKR